MNMHYRGKLGGKGRSVNQVESLHDCELPVEGKMTVGRSIAVNQMTPEDQYVWKGQRGACT
jgi:hypothetical protein